MCITSEKKKKGMTMRMGRSCLIERKEKIRESEILLAPHFEMPILGPLRTLVVVLIPKKDALEKKNT